jgi:hypothetical protein
MNEIIQKDILDIIAQAIEIIKSGNPYDLKELSDHTIHNASIYQDEHSVSIAVIVYSLSKVIGHDDNNKGKLIELLQNARRYMERDELDKYKKTTSRMLELISRVDSRFSKFVDDVIIQAQIKKSSKIYDHGISLGQAASILGISQWELMQYTGHTRSADSKYERPDVINKIKFTRGLFE